MGLHHHYYADDLYYSPTPLLFANPSNAAVCVCRDADRDAEADRQDSEGAISAAARVTAPTPRAAAQSGPTRHEARKEVVSGGLCREMLGRQSTRKENCRPESR